MASPSTVAATSTPEPDRWSVATGSLNGRDFNLRYNHGAARLIPGGEYTHQASITVTEATPQVLRQAEESLIELLERDRKCLEVAVLSFEDGSKEFIFYSSDPDDVKAQARRAHEQNPHSKFRIMVVEDKDWNFYKKLSPSTAKG